MTVTVTEKKNKLSKRLSSLVATGGIPAAIVSFVGDLFAPKGGWIVIGIVGVLAIIVCSCLVASLWNRNEGSPMPWWYRATSGDEELNWIWDARNPLLAHGVHVVLLFGIVCLFVSHKSYAAVDNGGVLAEKMEMIAVAQQQLGISQQLLDQQRKGTAAVESLSIKADNFKQETSASPRKELANIGVPFTDEGLKASIRSNDVYAVRLFAKAGFRPSKQSEGVIVSLAINASDDIAEAVRAFDIRLPFAGALIDHVFGCVQVASDLPESPSPAKLQLFRESCGSSENLAQATEALARARVDAKATTSDIGDFAQMGTQLQDMEMKSARKMLTLVP